MNQPFDAAHSPSGIYQWFDRAPRGRNETGALWHRHDEHHRQ
jgi:predicted dithiol-disulfide oxidoreductase (DUF899 family)